MKYYIPILCILFVVGMVSYNGDSDPNKAINTANLETNSELPPTGTPEAITSKPTATAAVTNLQTPTINESAQSNTHTGNNDAIDHITKTGKKYHTAACPYLRQSDITVTLDVAKSQGLSPCSKCGPPQ